MKAILTILLVLAFVVSIIPQDSLGQEKKKGQNSIQNNVQSYKDIGSQKVITSALPINTEIAKIPEPTIDAPTANRTASVSGNWNNTATWGNNPVPVAGDNVTINSGITVTVTAPAVCATIIFAAVNQNSAITINGTNSLTVSGQVTMPKPSSSRTCNINVNAGTFSCGSLTMLATNTGRPDNINITTGTVTVSGSLSTDGNGCFINITGTGTLNIGGPLSGNPTIPTVPGCSVNYTSSSSQTIYPITYQGNLGLSGTGTKTISSDIYLTNTVTVSGNLTNSSTLVLEAGTSTLNTWLVMGGNVTNTGTITSTGNYTRFYFGSANAQTFTNNGTVTAPMACFDVANTNASGLTLTGNGFNVTRANLFYGTVVNSNKITLGTGGTSYAVVQRGVLPNTSPAGRFVVSPTFNVGSGGLILLYDNGSVAYNTGFEVPGSSTCDLLYLFDAADVTLNSNLTVTSELNFSGGTGTSALRIAANTLTLGGDITYTVAGAFYGGTSSNLVLNGSTTLNTITNGLNNFTINSNTTLGGAVLVNGLLTLTNGCLKNGAYLTMANGSTITRTAAGSLTSAPAFQGTVNLIYTGSSPVTTGKELPTSPSVINNLTSNAGGVTQYAYTSSTTNLLTDAFPNLTNWTGNKGTGSMQFNTNTSALAGGTSPEGRYYCSEFTHQNVTNYIYRIALNTTGYTAINVSFKTYAAGNYTQNYPTYLKLQSSTSTSGPWHDVWSMSYAPHSATNISVPNYTTDVGGNIYFQFVFAGDPYALDTWNFDNLIVDGVSNTPVASNITVNGTLDLQNGIYNIGSGNTLRMANGTTINRSDGSLSAAPVFGTSVNLVYSGSNPITTGVEIPVSTSVLNNLTINNAGGVSLGSNATIKGTSSFTSGLLQTGTYFLNFGTSAVNPIENSSSRIVGNAKMTDRIIGTGSIYFLNCYIGGGLDNLGNINITRITGENGAVTYNGNTGIQTNWDIQSTNPPSAGRNVTFEWLSEYDPLPPFISGDLANIFHSTDNGATWTLTGNAVDPTTYSGTLRGITENTTHFSMWTIGRNDAPLPVQLSSFTSSPRGRNINLDWVTASEINNSGFNVERAGIRHQATDNWERIGFVNGKGTVNTATKYSFEDKNLQTGKYKYRLKQIDNNGNFEYFALNGEVEVGVPNKFNITQNYPNPFNPTTKIDFDLPSNSKINIVLYDISGREVKTLVNEARSAGYYTVNFNASDLSSGMYFYRIIAVEDSPGRNIFVMTKKMMMVK